MDQVNRKNLLRYFLVCFLIDLERRRGHLFFLLVALQLGACFSLVSRIQRRELGEHVLTFLLKNADQFVISFILSGHLLEKLVFLPDLDDFY